MTHAQKQHQPTTPEQAAAERRAAFRWISFIVAILGTSVTVAMVMLYVSATDPSVGVEPDYYQQALHWDEHAAQRRVNAQLGWSIDLRENPADTIGQRELTLSLTDREGDPIEDATVGVVAFHNARAADRFAFPMLPAGDGLYTAVEPLKRAGRWEFRFTVVTPDSIFTEIMPADLQPLAGAGIRQ